MEVYRDLQKIRKEQNSVLTVGSFDGIHLGHQFILDHLRQQARDLNAMSTLVTFSPHPKLVLQSASAHDGHKILSTIAEKLEILQDMDIDRVVVIPFTREFSQTPSDEFVQDILFEVIGFKKIIIGYDHAFGRNREGGSQTLKELGNKLGFEVEELPEFKNKPYVLNSTNIRRFLSEGNVREAARALGRNYRLSGIVRKGNQRGHKLAYPTANIEPIAREKLIPARGVYAVCVHYAGKKLKGMMNIGVRPTFNETSVSLEVHIFDFNQNLYGKEIAVEFVDCIREEQQFSRPEELIKQLHIDKKNSLKILSNE